MKTGGGKKKKNYFLSQFCGQQLSPEFCTSCFPSKSTKSTQIKTALWGMVWGSGLVIMVTIKQTKCSLASFSTFTPPLNRVRKVKTFTLDMDRASWRRARVRMHTHLAWACLIAQSGQRMPLSVACAFAFSIRSPAFPTHSWVNLLESNVGSIEQRALSACLGAKGQRSHGIHW